MTARGEVVRIRFYAVSKLKGELQDSTVTVTPLGIAKTQLSIEEGCHLYGGLLSLLAKVSV